MATNLDRIKALEAWRPTVETRLTALTSRVTALEAKDTTLVAADAALDTRLDVLEVPEPPPPPPPPSATAGPRYDLIGGTRFPPLPTPHVVVPATVPTNGTDCSGQLAAFLNNRTLVPDGTTVVFDKTLLGAGTTYTLDHRVLIGAGGIVRRNLTFWGYNTKIVQRTLYSPTIQSHDSVMLSLHRGGWRNVAFLGFEMAGPNHKVATTDAMSLGAQHGHAFIANAVDGYRVQDCWVHGTQGDAVCGGVDDTTTADHDPTLAEVANIDISYNLFSGIGRQGVTWNRGNGIAIHHNVIEDTALSCVDFEDHVSGTNRRVVNVDISDNIMRRWNWSLPRPGAFGEPMYFNANAIAIVHTDPRLDYQGDITIARNQFLQGARGYGDPDAEMAILGRNETKGCETVMVLGYPWQGVENEMKHGVTIEGNVIALDADQSHANCRTSPSQRGEAVVVNRWADYLTIRDNQFGAKGIWYGNGTGTVTIANNGTGAVNP